MLSRTGPRSALLEALEDVDRLVLLGDVLELRHRPPRYAMAAARPFFEELGRVLAAREIVVSAGNHDHLLVESWLGERALHTPQPFELEQRLRPEQASPMLAQLAEWAAPAHVSVAYPGLWVREDVYAMHGHYLDAHLSVPTIERLSIAVMSRVLGRPAAAFSSVEDYEAVGAPVFAWRDAVAREARPGGAVDRVEHDPCLARARGRGRWLLAGSPSCVASRSPAPFRSPWRRSTAPGWARCAPTSRAMSCTGPGCARSARWPIGSASATLTWSSATPTAPGRYLAMTGPSGAGVAARG